MVKKYNDRYKRVRCSLRKFLVRSKVPRDTRHVHNAGTTNVYSVALYLTNIIYERSQILRPKSINFLNTSTIVPCGYQTLSVVHSLIYGHLERAAVTCVARRHQIIAPACGIHPKASMFCWLKPLYVFVFFFFVIVICSYFITIQLRAVTLTLSKQMNYIL